MCLTPGRSVLPETGFCVIRAPRSLSSYTTLRLERKARASALSFGQYGLLSHRGTYWPVAWKAALMLSLSTCDRVRDQRVHRQETEYIDSGPWVTPGFSSAALFEATVAVPTSPTQERKVVAERTSIGFPKINTASFIATATSRRASLVIAPIRALLTTVNTDTMSRESNTGRHIILDDEVSRCTSAMVSRNNYTNLRGWFT
jgi:hypothetical protein